MRFHQVSTMVAVASLAGCVLAMKDGSVTPSSYFELTEDQTKQMFNPLVENVCYEDTSFLMDFMKEDLEDYLQDYFPDYLPDFIIDLVSSDKKEIEVLTDDEESFSDDGLKTRIVEFLQRGVDKDKESFWTTTAYEVTDTPRWVCDMLESLKEAVRTDGFLTERTAAPMGDYRCMFQRFKNLLASMQDKTAEVQGQIDLLTSKYEKRPKKSTLTSLNTYKRVMALLPAQQALLQKVIYKVLAFVDPKRADEFFDNINEYQDYAISLNVPEGVVCDEKFLDQKDAFHDNERALKALTCKIERCEKHINPEILRADREKLKKELKKAHSRLSYHVHNKRAEKWGLPKSILRSEERRHMKRIKAQIKKVNNEIKMAALPNVRFHNYLAVCRAEKEVLTGKCEKFLNTTLREE